MNYIKDTTFSNGRSYVGASDVPTLALLNKKYGQTPLTLWETLTKRKEQWKGNEATEWGHELEGLILRKALYKLKYGHIAEKYYLDKIKNKNVTKKGGLILHNNTEAICPYFEHLKAHADLIIDDNGKLIIIEAKSSKFFASKRSEDENEGYSSDNLTAEGIPLKVYLQVQTQMMCYDIDTAYVALLSDTSSHRIYGEIKPDKKTQEHILALCQNFWKCVENDEPPRPETWDDVCALNPNIDEESKVVISGDIEQNVLIMKDQYTKIKKAIKKLEEKEEDIKNAIGLILGGNKYLCNAYGDELAKLYYTRRETISLKDIKKEVPEMLKILEEKNLIKKSESRSVKL